MIKFVIKSGKAQAPISNGSIPTKSSKSPKVRKTRAGKTAGTRIGPKAIDQQDPLPELRPDFHQHPRGPDGPGKRRSRHPLRQGRFQG